MCVQHVVLEIQHLSSACEEAGTVQSDAAGGQVKDKSTRCDSAVFARCPFACAAEDAGAEGELWQALGMPNSPFESLPELPDLIRRDLFGPLDLLLALAGHLARVRLLLHLETMPTEALILAVARR